jgi:hypothetical protein
MYPMRRFAVMLTFACSCVAVVDAQRCLLTATVTGVVTDPTGARIRGATITSIGVDGSSENASSGDDGHWRIACLPMGIYRFHISSPGFQSLELAPVPVQSERTISLTTRLRVETVTEQLHIEDETNAARSGGANVLSSKQLDGLAEDPDDLQRQLQALAAASGGMPGSALITVDGFQSPSTLPPKSSIQEIRISPDMFSAEYEYPPYAGGRIELFTKPGQDRFHGAVFESVGSHIWNANDPLSTTGTPANKEREGFEFSGPILSGKRADFALDLDYRSVDENAVVNASVLSPSGAPVSFNQAVATPQRLWLANGRTAWQLGTTDNLTVSLAANNNSFQNKGVGGLVLQEAGAFGRVSDYDLRAVNTTFLTQQLLHSTRVGFSWKTTDQTPNSASAQVLVAGAFTGGGSTTGNLHDTEHDLEFDDELYLSLKKQTVKSGIQFLSAFLHDNDPDTFNGAYVFGGGSAPALDGSGASITVNGLEQYRRTLAGLPGGRPTTYSQTSGIAAVPLDQSTVAAYVQDDWKINTRLAASGGLRYFAQTAPTVTDGFAPRIGGSYAFGKKQTWILHARTGLFYAPIGSAVSLETVRLNGTRQKSLTVYSPDFADPLGQTAATQPIQKQRRFSASIGITPSSQSQLSVEHTFFKSWFVNANAYYTASWGVLRSTNANAPLVFQAASVAAVAPRPLASDLNLFEYGRSGRFAGPFAFLGVNHFGQRFSLISGYLYSGFRTNAENPNAFPQSTYTHTHDWARPTGTPTHSLFAVIIYSFPFTIGSTTNLSIASGAPYDVTTGSDNNGDGVFNDRPSLVSTPGAGIYPTRFGLLSTDQVNGDLPRNIGTMPSTIHLDFSLNRSFPLKEKHGSASHQQTLRFDARSSNLLNHANYTAIDGIVGTPQFTQPVAAGFGRRLEFAAHLSF